MKNDGFVKVANTNDIPVSQMKEVQVNGQNICLANIDGKYLLSITFVVMKEDPLLMVDLKGTK